MKHRVLVIGTGSIGERHTRCFLATGRTDVGICEVNETLRQEVAARYKLAESFADLDAAMRQKWDAAVVATPAHTHIPISLRLADAKVNLLIEKPLSTSTQGVSELMEKVRSRELVAAIAYPYRADPGMTQMREALLSGRWGKPAHLVFVGGQHFPLYRPAYRNIYFTDRAKGGGSLQDAMTHFLNAGEWLLGPIDRVIADVGHQVLEGIEVEDTVHVLARHGPVMASYTLSMFQYPNEITFSINCEKGTVRYERSANRWRWMSEPSGPWHDEPWPPQERDDWFIAQANAYLNAVEGRSPVGCTLEDGLQTLRVNLAALASADSGGSPREVARS